VRSERLNGSESVVNLIQVDCNNIDCRQRADAALSTNILHNNKKEI
jgi:hypothetical protein